VILYPAIDIRGGQAVRLLQGDYERETAYDADPADAAVRWAEEGAEILHVVDLDGARAGLPQNLTTLDRISSSVDCRIQFGGGLRDMDWLGAAFEAGADRAVIGTAALRDPVFLERALEEYGDRIVVSVDAKSGMVSLAGWRETSDLHVADAVAMLTARGVERFLCTAIEVDGTMEGPAIAELNGIAAGTTAHLIASGGVGDLADLERLKSIGASTIEGAIVGRALYERRFTVAEAIAALAAS
jgi:phosphoribosylformimino-5-aminoimidazole carboxamide ribotide isomerase